MLKCRYLDSYRKLDSKHDILRQRHGTGEMALARRMSPGTMGTMGHGTAGDLIGNHRDLTGFFVDTTGHVMKILTGVFCHC